MINLFKDKRKNVSKSECPFILGRPGTGKTFCIIKPLSPEIAGISQKLTIEEIYMILLCSAREKETKDKDGIIKELRSYLEVETSGDVNELIHRTILKVQDFTEEELKVTLDYPMEQE